MKIPNRLRSNWKQQHGATLIEVLVALLILMVSLLGLVGVMIQSQRSQVESYERVQALLLVQEMAARINANRGVASCYQGVTLGTGNTAALPACTASGSTAAQKARVASDLQQWQDLLLGSAETSGGSNVGAVLGARGCISLVPASASTAAAAGNLYQVSVAWQGNSMTAAPPAGIDCGQGAYGDDAQRRAVSVVVKISNTGT